MKCQNTYSKTIKKIFENGLQVVANGDTSISELMRVIED